MTYRAPKILSIVNSLASLHGLKGSDFHIHGEAAMVVHGILTHTNLIEVSVKQDVWEKLAKFFKVQFSSMGGVICPAPGVEVDTISSLPTEFTWEKRHQVNVATGKSLVEAYAELVRRDELAACNGNVEKYAECLLLVERFVRQQINMRHSAQAVELKKLAPLLLQLTELNNLVELAESLEETANLQVEFKDHTHARWEINLNNSALTMYEVGLGGRQLETRRYTIENLKKTLQE